MRIGKIASSAEYRGDEQFQNFQLLAKFWFYKLKEIYKFVNFTIWKNPKIVKLKSSENFQSEISKNLQFGKFWKLSIRKIRKICTFGNSKNLEFGKFEQFAIQTIPKISNLENFKNF